MRLRRALTLVFLLGSSASAQGALSLPAPGMLKADGSITSLTRAGSRIVLTGTFSHIGPYVGGAVALDPATGARDTRFPRLDGQVSDAISDTAGGWYVAGQFLIGGVRRSVTHILASGEIDPDFDARIQSFVTSLVFQNGRLYAGRYFWPSDKDAGVVALDKTTGARIAEFKPAPGGTGVTELLNARYLYVGRTQGGVRALDARFGGPATDFDCACTGHVTALAEAGNALYIGTSEHGVIAVDERTGKPILGFSPKPDAVIGAGVEDQGPLVFLVDGDRLIVGGRGLKLGGPSSSLVALDLRTGAADPSFGRGFVNPIHDIVADGDSLLVAGAPRPGHTTPIIRIDRATGAYRDALTPELDGQVDALAGGGKELFVGGRFGSAQTTTTDGVAEVDARSGRLVPGFRVRGLPGRNPAPPLVAGDSLIFPPDLGGGTRLSSFSRLTGVRKAAFAPAPLGHLYLSAFAASDERVYVSYVTDLGNSEWPQNSVRVLSSHSGRRIAQYELPYRGYVNTLLPHRGQLFAAGSFRRFHPDGTPRHLATMALDPLTGAIDDGFDAHTNGPVNSVLGFRDRLYLSGYYGTAYGRTGLAGESSAYDNTGAIVAGFSTHVSVSDVAYGALTASPIGSGTAILADPYTGRREARLPTALASGGFTGNELTTPTGTYTTATLNLPWSSTASLYDDFAVLLPYGE
ncbi:MAG: hypothetical protein JWM73_1880 [Solirubrobacterales bacterium]|nr:hypothetical protein [Solirubrobacterales bacterium]